MTARLTTSQRPSTAFGKAFGEGFLAQFGDVEGTLERVLKLHVANAPYLPLLSNVIMVGVLYGAGEYVVETVHELMSWLDPEAIRQMIESIATLLESNASDLGRMFGEATGLMAKEKAQRLLAATAPGWYAFELGRLLGPLIFDVVAGAVFAAYVVPRLATIAAALVRETIESLDEVMDLRRAWAKFDRHTPDADGGGGGDGNGNGRRQTGTETGTATATGTATETTTRAVTPRLSTLSPVSIRCFRGRAPTGSVTSSRQPAATACSPCSRIPTERQHCSSACKSCRTSPRPTGSSRRSYARTRRATPRWASSRRSATSRFPRPPRPQRAG